MQQDVRRRDATDSAGRTSQAAPTPSPEPRTNALTRAFSQLGGRKRSKREAAAGQDKLNDRLREVLERDRALIASQPPAEEQELEPHADDTIITVASEFELDEPWPDPFGHNDPELQTGTRATLRERERQALALATERESSELALSQIASWIEEEISDVPEPSSEPVSLEVPLDEHEAAELDAVLTGEPELHQPDIAVAEPDRRNKSSRTVPRPQAKPKLPPEEEGESVESGRPEPICTLTMARLLAMQGYKPRAIAVYRELLKRTPNDETLRVELARLEAED